MKQIKRRHPLASDDWLSVGAIANKYAQRVEASLAAAAAEELAVEEKFKDILAGYRKEMKGIVLRHQRRVWKAKAERKELMKQLEQP